MAQFVKLNPEALQPLREVDARLVSYDVEMAEVTGGTFWKAYTPAQIAGKEEFVLKKGTAGLMLVRGGAVAIEAISTSCR